MRRHFSYTIPIEDEAAPNPFGEMCTRQFADSESEGMDGVTIKSFSVVQSEVSLNPFRPSSFAISVVCNMFDSVNLHTNLLDDLSKLFYMRVVGAGSDGDSLLL
jgi:hypothetical protein